LPPSLRLLFRVRLSFVVSLPSVVVSRLVFYAR
jgi:hypothetical protein